MLDRALFLAARTPRSQAYAQAMAAAGLRPGQVLVCGEPDAAAPSAPMRAARAGGIALPDLAEPLESTCGAAGWSTETTPARNVNDADVIARIRALRPSCVIYSGFGGQIVWAAALDLGVPFLHSHSGWLPRYRGSTTVYYSILEARQCAASVLALAPEIDAGPVLARRRYPLPPAGLDVDRLYDSAIRADLLCSVLAEIDRIGTLPRALDAADEASQTYFVIHPVLKHLALLSLPAQSDAPVAGGLGS
jgi:methionyl-tRNA formyltransferase